MTEKKLIDDCFYIQEKKYGLWTQPTLKAMDWSHLSLKTNVSQRRDFILRDGRRVSLNPKLMKGK